jgi:hypothetical protein
MYEMEVVSIENHGWAQMAYVVLVMETSKFAWHNLHDCRMLRTANPSLHAVSYSYCTFHTTIRSGSSRMPSYLAGLSDCLLSV